MTLKHDWTITNEYSIASHKSFAKSEEVDFFTKQLLEECLTSDDLFNLSFAKYFLDHDTSDPSMQIPRNHILFYILYKAIAFLVERGEYEANIPWLKECIKCQMKVGYLPDLKNVISPKSYREFEYQDAVERDIGSPEYRDYLKFLIDLPDEEYMRHLVKQGVRL